MSVDGGKLLYRGWDTPENLLYASSPTGNGELVCAKEYEYSVSLLTMPNYNTPFLSWYDGYNPDSNYDTPFLDGFPLYDSTGLNTPYSLGYAYPHTGAIPFPSGASPLLSGVMRYGTVIYHTNPGHSEDDLYFQWIVKPFMFFASNNLYEAGTNKKLWLCEVIHNVCIIQYDEAQWPKPDSGYYTFQEVINIVSNWNYTEWWNGKSRYITKKTAGWNYRVKGYGDTIILNQATPAWYSNNNVSHYDVANSELLSNQGSFKVTI